MLDQFFGTPLLFFISFFAIIIAITIHEFAHAWVADKLGDPTPRVQDRVSLNPLKHLDPIGTLAMVLTRFGWGKPVEFDPYNLKNPRRDSALIALAGPVSNILLAITLAIVYRLFFFTGVISLFLFVLITYNVSLAIFNLLPIHPLDGGKVAVGLLPKEYAVDLDRTLHRYGVFILILLIFPFGNSQSPVSYLILPVVNGILKLLLG